MGTQVSGLDNRVDGVITGLGGVQGELKAINQRLVVLEEIRDRIEGLASVEPDSSAGGSDPVVPTADPFVATAEGFILAGHIDPNSFATALGSLAAKYDTVRMVGADAPDDRTQVIYASSDVADADFSAGGLLYAVESGQWQGFDVVSSIEQFTESVERQVEEHPEGGVLLISTSDPALQDIAGQYGVRFNR